MRSHRANQALNYFLAGPSGSGKSWVLNELRSRMKSPTAFTLFDLDEEVARLASKKPAQIIREQGQEKFRKIEQGVLQGLLRQSRECEKGSIIGLGGGTWIPSPLPDDVALVFISTPFHECWERIKRDSDNRPMVSLGRNWLAQREERRRDQFMGLSSYHGSSSACLSYFLRICNR